MRKTLPAKLDLIDRTPFLLWTLEEYEIVATLWPDIDAIRKRLPHRSRKRIVEAASKCHVRRRIHSWTARENTTLRSRVMAGIPRRQIARELGLDLMQVQNRLGYSGIKYGRQPYKPTGDKLKDAIRQRVFDMNMTLVELDEACGSGMYFQKFYGPRPIIPKFLERAVQVLGGKLTIEWEPI